MITVSISSTDQKLVIRLKHKIDYEHYIEKQIKPIAKTILETLNIDFEDSLTGSKQKTLF